MKQIILIISLLLIANCTLPKLTIEDSIQPVIEINNVHIKSMSYYDGHMVMGFLIIEF